jgi:putative FmdB family regulatory protein
MSKWQDGTLKSRRAARISQGRGAIMAPILETSASSGRHPFFEANMPIYAYRCSSCGHSADVMQKLSEAPLTVCTVCGQASFSKQITAAGFQLKGSGWYVTDFKNGSKPAKKDTTAGEKPAETAGAAKPTESSSDKKSASDTKKSEASDTKPAPPASGSNNGGAAGS